MKRFMLRTIAGVTLVLVSLFALDMAPAVADDNIIKERIHLMRKGVLGNFKVIMTFVKDGKGSMAEVEKAAKGVQAAAAKVPALFPKGTGRPDVDEKKTRSLAKIWEDWATFEKANNAMASHAGAVAAGAAKGDTDGVKRSFGMMGKEGCGGCHKSFRGPKAK